MATEVVAVDVADLLEGGPVLLQVGGEDLHRYQVLGPGAGGSKGGERVRRGHVELLRQGCALDAPIFSLGGLPGQVDGPAGAGQDTVRVPGGLGDGGRAEGWGGPGPRPP